MIIIRVRRHRFDTTGEQTHIAPYREGCPLSDYVPMSAIVNPEAFVYIVSGFEVPAEHIHRFTPKDGDEIIIYPRHEGAFAALGAILGGAIARHLGFSIATWAVNGFFIGSIADSVFGTSFIKPRMPSFSLGDNFLASSPTYAWEGIQNNTSPDMPVPIVYGQHRTGGTIISAFVEGERQFDFSWQTLTLLDVQISGYQNSFRTADVVNALRIKLKTYPLAKPSSGAHYVYEYIGLWRQSYDKVKEIYRNRDFYKLYVTSTLQNTLYIAGYKIEYKPTNSDTWTTIYAPKDEQYIHYRFYSSPGFDDIIVEIPELEPAQYDVRITMLNGDLISGVESDVAYYTEVSGSAKTPSNTKPDLSYLNVLLALSEGEIEEVSNIEINDTPLEYFADGEVRPYVAVRYGTNDQTPIEGFNKIHNRYEYNVLLEKDTPQTFSTHDIVDGIVLEFTFPEGLSYIEDDGDISPWQVDIKVEVREVGATMWQTIGIATISSSQRSSFKRYFDISGITSGQYEIRLTRLTDNPDWRHYGEVRLTAIDELVYADLAYPNTALLGLRLLATSRLQGGMPKITCLVKGKKVLQPRIRLVATDEELDYEEIATDSGGNYIRIHDNAPAYWDGTWTVKWSANPVWCLYDLITNERYGLGQFIEADEIDLDEWHEMAKYCDRRIQLPDGSYEKYFRLDIVIDSPESALDLITRLASTFRAFPIWSEGKLNIRIDKPENPVQIFNMGNIIEGSFSEAFTSRRNKANIIEVQFFAKDNDYEREVVQLMDEEAIANGEPENKKIYPLVGVTRLTQALRIARYLLNLEKYATRSITFKVATDALNCQAGDVIGVQHDVPQWCWGGRIQYGTTTQIIVDQQLTLEEGTSYYVLIRYNDDDSTETRAVENRGITSTLYFTSDPLPKPPQKNDLWVVGTQYPVMKEWRIISIERANDLELTITAIEHYDEIYNDTTDDIPELPDYSYLSPPPSLARYAPPVADLAVDEVIYKRPDGTIGVKLIITFTPPTRLADYFGGETYDHAKIYISEDDGRTWQYQADVYGDTYILDNAKEGRTYKIAVVSVGKGSAPIMPVDIAPQVEHTVIGKSAPPSDVENFTASQHYQGIKFDWDVVSDVDIAYYEIREGRDWDNGVIVGRPTTPPFYIPYVPYGTHTYHIKAVDTTGHYSENPASDTITVSIAPPDYPLEYTDRFPDCQHSGAIITAYKEDYTRGVYRKCITLGTTNPRWGQTGRTWADGGVWTEIDTTTSYTYASPVLDAGDDVSLPMVFSHTENTPNGASVSYRIYIRPSTGGWTELAPEELDTVYCRYLYVEAELQAGDPYNPPVVWQMKLFSTSEEKRVAISNIAVPTAGKTIPFADYGLDFDFVKSVVVSTVGASPYIPVVESQDNDGCVIKLYAADGTPASGYVNILVIGI